MQELQVARSLPPFLPGLPATPLAFIYFRLDEVALVLLSFRCQFSSAKDEAGLGVSRFEINALHLRKNEPTTRK